MAENNMANRNKSLQLKKFKRVASKALRMERERSELEMKLLSTANPNKVIRDPQPEIKDLHMLPPLSIKRPPSKLMPLNMRPSSQPPSSRRVMSMPLCVNNNELPGPKPENNKLHGHISDDIYLLGRRSPEDNVYLQHRLRRTLDDQMFAHHPKDNYVQQHLSNDEDILHRRQVKQLHDHAQQRVRVATAAAAAAASTVVAQIRKDAIDAVAHQQAPYMRMAAIANARSKSSNKSRESDQRRVIRNSNLLSSALSIIREMDPAFLETLCYAIHDQVTKDDAPESD
ncbi:uncharacterized protein LOC111595813 isoform X2 [Drosophila hydei]|uniref:Uncharacterized protein LOC111595813 isoform X2 n=1 Tax=Drosophila hydei TaxID=7224 RepID=A0A6J1LF18_DROHY|nr:uncharacterized protein LOC111595813 isoform X2 [Drosophila hydei]